jgi:hypothetical protein
MLILMLCFIARFESAGSIDLPKAPFHFNEDSELSTTGLQGTTSDVTGGQECTIALLTPSDGESLFLGRTVIMWNVSFANVSISIKPFLNQLVL